MTTGNNTAELIVSRWGRDVLNDPEINKGPAFTAAERRVLDLEGLLPAVIEDVAEARSKSD